MTAAAKHVQSSLGKQLGTANNLAPVALLFGASATTKAKMKNCKSAKAANLSAYKLP